MSKCRFDLSEDCHNKDCLDCVLDKIRTEIEETKKNPLFNMVSKETILEVIIEIIDKYKTESEDTDDR